MSEPVTAITPDTECADCKNGVHRFRIHSGRKLLCQMASCDCHGFRPKVEEAEAEEPVAV